MYIYTDTCKSPASKVKTSSILVVCHVSTVAEEIKSHKQTLVKPKKPRFPVHTV